MDGQRALCGGVGGGTLAVIFHLLPYFDEDAHAQTVKKKRALQVRAVLGEVQVRVPGGAERKEMLSSFSHNKSLS